MIHVVVVRDLGRMLLMKLVHRYVCICIECCIKYLNGANVDAFPGDSEKYDMQVKNNLV